VPTPLLVVLGVLLVITVLTHLPIILIGLLVWFFVISRVRRHSAVRRW
jgi:Zn-dependent membrane protease YugP